MGCLVADQITANKTLFADVEATEGTAATSESESADAILASGITFKPALKMNDRVYQGSPGQRDPIPGAQEGAEVSFTTELKGNGTTTIPEVDVLLTACFGSVVAADLDTTISGAAGSATVLNVAAATNASNGSLVMLETATADTYEVLGIISASDVAPVPDTITVTPGAVNGGYATAGKKVKEMRTYQILMPPATNNSVTLDAYYNANAGAGQRERVVGARGTFKMDSPRAGAIPSFAWMFKGWSIARLTSGTRPTPTYDSANPKAAVSSIFRVNSTYTNAFDISFELGAEVALKMSQNSTTGAYGAPSVSYKPKGSFKIHPAHSSIAEFTAWEAGTAASILFQVGNALYGTWAIFVPRAVRVMVDRVDDGGVQAQQIDWVAAETADALATAGEAAMYLGVG